MKNTPAHSRLLLGPLLVLGACSGGSDDPEDTSFLVRSTNVATSAGTIVRISGPRIAFLAAEDTTSTNGSATILNDDGDTMDGVAHVVNSAANTQFRLGVAADDLAWVGGDLYLAVNEGRDGHDWNGDMLQQDEVLLHWSETTNVLQRVDDLATDPDSPGQPFLHFVPLDGRIVYVAKLGGTQAGESNLRFVESADPLVPIPVATTDAVSALVLRLIGEDEGLVFLAFDEVLAGRTLNGDMDATDRNVLGLLDGSASTSIARSTALAIDPESPLRANSTGPGDWQVGFLVSEALQGNTSRNSNSSVGPNFRPTQCTTNDVDALDHVLTVLAFADWNADPVANPPRNHGLAGQLRIAFANGFVATIVSEFDDSGCDLNDDMDDDDLVVRWMPIADDAIDPLLPLNDPSEIRALFDAPGGGHGLYELSNRFVIVASESAGGDIDANFAIDANLVGWLAPTSTLNDWDFTHGVTNDQAVEASWVSASESENRLGIAFTERIGGVSLNTGSLSNPGDNDTLDAIPTFATFGSGRLLFPSAAIGLDRDSAGIATAGGWSFYRISEAEDSRDINADGDEMDFILERTNLSTLATFGLSVIVDQARDAAFFARFGPKECGAMLVTEALQGNGGTDFNGDGDATDVVLRWFAF